MPRYTVHVRGEWLAVPCLGSTNTIEWLGKEAVRRYMKNKPDNGGFASVEEVKFYMRRCKGLGLLDLDDTVGDALEDNEFVEVDGNSLTTEDLVNLGKGLYKIKLTPEAEAKVKQSREVIERIVKEQTVVYGITTGFGKFARTVIPNSKLRELQVNLVRSHSAGVGKPLTPERSRMLLALRINVLAKGYSGISLETLEQVIEAFNASCLPYIPEKGTVGASGDLAPLSHLALGLIGEGKMWSPKSGWADAKYVLEAHGLKPITLKPKEGLALINGTQMITSLGCEAVERAGAIARQADIIAALTLEVLKGTTRAFDTVSENKALCHPSSVDSLSTSAATEDHVSMGGWAARKALRVIEHVEQVLAIELLAACQGIEFLRPLRTTTPLEKVYDLVRSVVRPWMKDRFMAPDIEAAHRLLVEQKVWEVAKPYIEKYRREHIPESRPISPTAFSLGSLRMNADVSHDHRHQDEL
ncbi:hypothetical protein WISP_86497 [Willisornis vidua]|uniref:HUTH lyase n=1 Tax=Willisornis vidua TaxID=1566151 RepID=A0ABQ9D7G1_9PASS|nr:hypothetical protein WISP_86497 [Willisornis vidua]